MVSNQKKRVRILNKEGEIVTKPRSRTPQYVLREAAKYMNPAQVNQVEQAYQFANFAHRGQYRKSGDQYITHPTQVAAILAHLRMDSETVSAGFLHDVIEDTSVTLPQLQKKFGREIALIVVGVTKLDRMKYHSHRRPQLTINFRRMMLAICPDIRSVVVKLADRLHNMRTLRYLPRTKRQKTSQETMEVYAPLADRLGIGTIKWQLQDLSLKYLEPEAYHRIAHHLSLKRSQRNQYVTAAINRVRHFISGLHLKSPLLYGRPKHIYSIYHKIVVRHKAFNQIYDFLAMRVIVDRVSECYAVLSAIEAHWSPMAGRFKDYIAHPKPNGYQSLHITVVGPKKKPFEVQIRTRKMHQVAEYGIAAHWAYKAGLKGKVKGNLNNSRLNWFKRMIAVQENSTNRQHPVYNFKSNLFNNRVYVLTPNGDVMEMPKGAGPLDLAYRIHTEVGNHAIGAKVNNQIVSWDYRLKTGDVVAIMTSANASPGHNWLRLAKTRRARQKIRQYFRRHNYTLNLSVGRNRVMREIKDREYPDTLMNLNVVEKIAKRRHFKSADDLFAAIGFGNVSPISVVNDLVRHLHAQQMAQQRQQRVSKSDSDMVLTHKPHKLNPVDTSKKSFRGIIVGGLSNLLVRLSHCCYPIPGDSIVGYITHGNGISIHRKDCPHAQHTQRLVTAHWTDAHQTNDFYESRLAVEAYDRGDLIHDVIRMTDQDTGQLVSFFGNYKNNQIIVIQLKVEVHNLDQLKKLIGHLRGISKVRRVVRD